MQWNFTKQGADLIIKLSGNCVKLNDTAEAEQMLAAARSGVKRISFETEELKEWDSTLLVVLYELALLARKDKIDFKKRTLPDNLRQMLDLAMEVDRKPEKPCENCGPLLFRIGNWTLGVFSSLKRAWAFTAGTAASLLRLISGTAVMRKVDFLFAFEDCSYKAIGIVSLVSFMVGLILAFVGAIQLKTFGAQIYVASLVAIGMTRIMGAIMVGIIMAGRTGAAYAATIGTMQVNEEIDALKTMGIPITDFLVLPRITALTLTMPILTFLADVMGIIGGAFVGVFMLGISGPEYYKYTFEALKLTNFWVGIFHGLIFGIIISLCGCYYGIQAGRNADSVGVAATKSVVSAIVIMIVATGLLTLFFNMVGI